MRSREYSRPAKHVLSGIQLGGNTVWLVGYYLTFIEPFSFLCTYTLHINHNDLMGIGTYLQASLSCRAFL